MKSVLQTKKNGTNKEPVKLNYHSEQKVTAWPKN